MSIISYFPKANRLQKEFPTYGDVITVRSMSTTSTGTTASYYSGNHILSTTSYTFSSIKSKITAAYLPECITIGSYTFNSMASLRHVSLPKCISIQSYGLTRCSLMQEANIPNCASLSNHAFYQCHALSKIYFPLCTSIPANCFYCTVSYSSTAERTVYLPECTYISANAFANNNIVDLHIPKVEIIGASAFDGARINFSSGNIYFSNCTSIYSYAFYNVVFTATDPMDEFNLNIHFSNCTSVGSYAFYSGYNARFVWFDNCTYLGESAFYNNINLVGVHFPKLSLIPAYAFYHTQFNEAEFPSCTYINTGAFASTNVRTTSFPLVSMIVGSVASEYATFRTTLLSTISFPKLTNISNGYVFAGCTSLMSIYLMNSVVCSLSTAYAFSYTPITNSTYTGTFGTVYVPASLLASYKAATNWKTISARLSGI